MNIFKKNIEFSFFEQVEQRIIQELHQNLPRELQERITKFLPALGTWIICLSIMSFIPLYASSFLSSDSVLFLFLQNFGGLAILTGLGGIIGSPFIYLTLRWYKKYLIKNPKHIAIHYQSLAKLFVMEKSLYLNTNEVNELLSMDLSNEQIQFLQETILNTNNFALDNLETLISYYSHEDVQTQQDYNQHRFNRFLNKHQISSHPYLNIEQKELQKEEKVHSSSKLKEYI